MRAARLPALFVVAALAAAEEAPLRAEAADLARLRTRFAASAIGRAWNDAAVAPVRDRIATAVTEAAPALAAAHAAALEVQPDPTRADAGAGDAAPAVIPPLPDPAGDDPWGAGEPPMPLPPPPSPVPPLALRLETGARTAEVFAAWQEAGTAGATPPGLEAAFTLGSGVQVARGGEALHVLAPGTVPVAAPAPGIADITLRVRPGGLLRTLVHAPAGDRAALGAVADLADRALGGLQGEATLVREGVLERWRLAPTAGAWLAPADRAVAARLPGNALCAGIVGLRGAAFWRDVAEPTLRALALADRSEPGALIARLDAAVAALGIEGGAAGVCAGLDGTVGLAVAAGAPIPGVTLMLPRTPPLDALIAALARAEDCEPPADGAHVVLSPRGWVSAVVIARDARAWLLTTDAFVVQDWLAGRGGWTDTASARAAFAEAGEGALLIGASDTRQLLRSALQLVAMAAQELEPEAARRNAWLALLRRLAANAASGWIVAQRDAAGCAITLRGVATPTVALGLATALYAPEALPGRAAANEAAVIALLRRVAAAQQALQRSGLIDQDGDGQGEHGFLGELAGARPLAAPPPMAVAELAQASAHGYRFVLWLPDGRGGAIEEPMGDGRRPAFAPAADLQERHYALYAWPEEPASGRRAFALFADGGLRARTWNGEEPTWDAALGDQGWGATPSWPAVPR